MNNIEWFDDDYERVNKKLICPNCKSKNLENIKGGYEGCCTDYGRYGQSQACSIKHDGKHCQNCGLKFFYGDEF